jgi:hypothetical protein
MSYVQNTQIPSLQQKMVLTITYSLRKISSTHIEGGFFF